jgi:fused signal recognition particle receptor
MWSAIKARLTGRAAAPPEALPAAEGTTSPKDGSPAGPFTDGWLGRGLKEATVDDVLAELELVLLQSDVALPVVEKIEADLRKNLAGRKLRWGADAQAAIRDSLSASVRAILSQPRPDLAGLIRARGAEPFIILFVGVNGTGKTTTIAKIAGWLRGQGFGVVIAAGDTFRAGAIEQLLVHGERLGIKVVRQQEGSDPAAVAFDAVQHAKARRLDVVLVDTAGRQHTNENLLAEAKKIRRVVKPQLTIFVGDALSGNDAVEQARLFTESLGVDALILTKLDADVKGGAALSAVHATGKPILFVGLGQGYGDLQLFDPEWMVARLFAEETPA